MNWFSNSYNSIFEVGLKSKFVITLIAPKNDFTCHRWWCVKIKIYGVNKTNICETMNDFCSIIQDKWYHITISI